MQELTVMPKYEAYKDSQEDWVAEVPDHWEVKKLKHLFYEKKHTRNMALSCGSISFGKVVTKDDDKVLYSTKASYQEVLNGEFLINPLNLNYDLISLRIGLSDIDVVVSAGYIVLKEKSNISKEYFKYLLHRYDVAYMKLLGSGVRQTINFNHIANSALPFPPLKEQTAIANFLDKKTTQIDEAIAIKQKQIELLKEHKQIIIQKAMTQGLDPNAPMRDSGVDWIGEIPEHWQQKKVKFISSFITSGPRGWSDFFTDEGAIFLQSGDLDESMGICLDSAVKVAPKVGAEGIRTKLHDNDVLVCITGAKTGKVSLALIEENEVYINQHLCLIRPTTIIIPRFLATSLYCSYGKTYFHLQQYGLKEGLGLADIKNAPILIPNLSEQQEILEHIDNATKCITSTIDLSHKQIKKLKEYKTTLINSAVTGKVKVPNIN